MWSQLTFHNPVFQSEIKIYQDHHTAEQVTKKSSKLILITYI